MTIHCSINDWPEIPAQPDSGEVPPAQLPDHMVPPDEQVSILHRVISTYTSHTHTLSSEHDTAWWTGLCSSQGDIHLHNTHTLFWTWYHLMNKWFPFFPSTYTVLSLWYPPMNRCGFFSFQQHINTIHSSNHMVPHKEQVSIPHSVIPTTHTQIWTWYCPMNRSPFFTNDYTLSFEHGTPQWTGLHSSQGDWYPHTQYIQSWTWYCQLNLSPFFTTHIRAWY